MICLIRPLLPLLLIAPLLTAPVRTMADANSSPVQLSASGEPLSLEQLPTGQYYYSSPQSQAKRPSFVLLRKSGQTVIGWDHRGTPACFRGFASGNQIINATRVAPPYQPDSELQQGEALDLSSYQIQEHSASEAEAAALRTCINFFWR